MLDVMSEPATTARPVGIVVKMTRRVAVAVTIALGVALLLLILWNGSASTLFLRAIMLALSATTVFSLFEVWPRRLPRGIERWIVQVVAVGAADVNEARRPGIDGSHDRWASLAVPPMKIRTPRSHPAR